MELFLAIAAVIVAIASLYLANNFNRRFSAHGKRLDQVAQSAERAVLAERQETAQIARQVKQAEQEHTDRSRKDWQTLMEERRKSEVKTADIANRVAQLGEEMTTAFGDHGARLESLSQLAEDLRSSNDLAAEAARLRTIVGQQTAALDGLRDDLASAGRHAAQTLTGFRQQLVAIVKESDLLQCDHADLRSQLRQWIGHNARLATLDPRMRILPGLIAAEMPAAQELLPCLYETLLRAVGLDPVFREQAGPAGVRYYLGLHSPGGQPPEQRLGRLLAANEDDSASLPGLTEFRSLLLAIYASGPGMMRAGPLIVSHTALGTFRGTVLTATETETTAEDEPASALIRWAERLDELSEDRIVNLAGWAASYVS